MTRVPVLGDIVPLADDALLAAWGVARALERRPLDRLGDFVGEAFAAARAVVPGPLVHPTAVISPLANIGPDVVIGPGCVVHEFSTVRGHSVLSAGVHVGFGCEVTNAVIGRGTRLAHQVCLGYSVVGQDVHFTAALTVASTHLWNPDMACPTRPIVIRLTGGELCVTGLAKLGALIGDRARIGMHAALGPGLILGADTVVYPGVTAAATSVPAGHIIRPASTTVAVLPRHQPLTSALASIPSQEGPRP
ncbi:transferase [Sphaerisporangium album]|uniref:Transferase n=1 Tax=Sphaerisporangium album TaxID=509200 RepID=A0A367FNH7_9ACTN|nr:transferase [Sphaerisporangium album]RCG31953.1 transferase [Sphaerisporangium album]